MKIAVFDKEKTKVKYSGLLDEYVIDKLLQELDGAVPILNEVFEEYAPKSAFELVAITHNDGAWNRARKGLSATDKSEEVADKIANSRYIAGVYHTREGMEGYCLGGGDTKEVIQTLQGLRDIADTLSKALAEEIPEVKLQEMFEDVKRSTRRVVENDETRLERREYGDK